MFFAIICVIALFGAQSWAGTARDITRADAIYQEKLQKYLETVPKEVADEALMTVDQLVKYKGYPSETHTVTTEDGYILTLHRIPYGMDGPSENRPIAFLQHGLLSSSADWIVPGPEKALAYILADQGYDVWMGIYRGNKYSRAHNSYSADNDDDFWQFSWHEMGVIDLPTMIDYVLEQTGQENLFYIGHSQGTTTFYVMASQLPEYNAKIRAMFSLAPIAYMSHMTSPLMQILSVFDGTLEFLFSLIGMNEFLPSSEFLASAGSLLCSDDSITQLVCTNALFVLCGFNKDQMNATLLPVVMGHTPAGSSIYQMLHYAQEIQSAKFRQYDYGLTKNYQRYGSLTPPNYDLKQITAPVYLHYSSNDWLSHPKDVLQLYDELGNVQGKFLVPDDNFNHIDYMYAIDAPSLLYNRIISLMTRH